MKHPAEPEGRMERPWGGGRATRPKDPSAPAYSMKIRAGPRITTVTITCFIRISPLILRLWNWNYYHPILRVQRLYTIFTHRKWQSWALNLDLPDSLAHVPNSFFLFCLIVNFPYCFGEIKAYAFSIASQITPTRKSGRNKGSFIYCFPTPIKYRI